MVNRRTPSEVALKAEYRFGLVLFLLLITFMVMASGLEGTWSRLTLVLLQGITLLAALYAADARPRVRRFALIVVIVVSLTALVTTQFEGSVPEAGIAILNGLLVLFAPIAIVRGIVRRQVIDIQTVLAALCVYVFLGMFFAFTYAAIDAGQDTPFFVQEANPTNADFLYFSFITQTTVGYGDLTAADNLGRSVAVLEALSGQIYLVTVVALLVSNLVPRRSSRRGDDDPEPAP